MRKNLQWLDHPEEQVVSHCHDILVLKEELAEMGKELAEKKKTLGGALLLNKSDSRECKLVCKGNDSSHRGSYTDVDSDDREFAIHPVPDTDANTKSSQLVGKIDAGRLSYVNEYDVQNWTHAALEDAVTICNALLSTDGPAHESIKLDLRRESHLDSNLLDHAVVYEEMSGLPIFEAETKEPVNVPLNHTSLGSVKGQVNTQLSAMTAFGHPNPFGALTTFNETRIVWIENDNTESVLSHRGNSLEDLVRAVQLDDIHTPVAEKLIQSPVKIAPTETALTKTQQTDAAREEEKRDDSDGAKRRSRRVKNTTGYVFEESSLRVAMSQPLQMHTLSRRKQCLRMMMVTLWNWSWQFHNAFTSHYSWVHLMLKLSNIFRPHLLWILPIQATKVTHLMCPWQIATSRELQCHKMSPWWVWIPLQYRMIRPRCLPLCTTSTFSSGRAVKKVKEQM